MSRDSSPRYGITRTLDERKYRKNLNSSLEFRRAKLWFLPIVLGGTLFFGLMNGVKGACVGFMYGVVAGLFLIHESLYVNKKW